MAYQFTQTGSEIQDILDLAQLKIAAPYDSGTSYVKGDYCTHEDGFFVANASTTGTWNASKWTAVTVGDVLEQAAADISALNATLTNITTYYNKDDYAAVSVPSGTSWIEVAQYTLPAGSYLIIGYAFFAQNSSGWRSVGISTTETPSGVFARSLTTVGAVDGNSTIIPTIRTMTLTGETIVRLFARQTSGSALNCYPQMICIRLR